MISHSNPTISQQEFKAVNSVLRSGFIAAGRMVSKFEDRFSKYIGTRFAVTTNSGTSALHLALLALKIKTGDEVIIPSFVCSAVLNAINYVDAYPKIADINIDDFNINLDSVKKKISRRTRVIIVPHMFGIAADMDGLLKLGIPIIEDCALSVGATYKGKKVGGFGLISVFSFYATKVLTTAEGGMLTTDEPRLYSYVQDIRDYDNKGSYRVRYNYKMNDLLAALGYVQLDNLSKFIFRRQEIARMYNKGLADTDIRLPHRNDKKKSHIYFRYVIRTRKNTAQFINKLRRLGIEAKKPVYQPLHRYLGLSDRDFPITSQVYKSCISLPIYPDLGSQQVRFIINRVKQVFKN